MDDKYVVLKTADWQALLLQHADLRDAAVLDPDSYFVVRDRDVFAPAGLYAYSHNMNTVLETFEALGAQVLDEDTRERLQNLAHDIATLADKWQRSEVSAKVPD